MYTTHFIKLAENSSLCHGLKLIQDWSISEIQIIHWAQLPIKCCPSAITHTSGRTSTDVWRVQCNQSINQSKSPEPPSYACTLKPSAGPSTTEGSENHEHSTGVCQWWDVLQNQPPLKRGIFIYKHPAFCYTHFRHSHTQTAPLFLYNNKLGNKLVVHNVKLTKADFQQ